MYDINALIDQLETPKEQDYKLEIVSDELDVSFEDIRLNDIQHQLIWRWEGPHFNMKFISQMNKIVDMINLETYKSHYTAIPGCIIYSCNLDLTTMTLERFAKIRSLFRDTMLRVIKDRFTYYTLHENIPF